MSPIEDYDDPELYPGVLDPDRAKRFVDDEEDDFFEGVKPKEPVKGNKEA